MQTDVPVYLCTEEIWANIPSEGRDSYSHIGQHRFTSKEAHTSQKEQREIHAY